MIINDVLSVVQISEVKSYFSVYSNEDYYYIELILKQKTTGRDVYARYVCNDSRECELVRNYLLASLNVYKEYQIMITFYKKNVSTGSYYYVVNLNLMRSNFNSLRDVINSYDLDKLGDGSGSNSVLDMLNTSNSGVISSNNSSDSSSSDVSSSADNEPPF